ncbi:unnamed protein product [Orchesella dallaii]|uniref:E3 ubiquitin-protein ligase n=1 Tax=Orchesella dallaii TaxID=48710 RepID=A0ABP1RWD0_9HEXA
MAGSMPLTGPFFNTPLEQTQSMDGFFNASSGPGARPRPEGHRNRDSFAAAGAPQCTICGQHYTFPIELPCQHVFCFMCIKGEVIEHNTRNCPLCRAAFPMSVINYPVPINPNEIIDELNFATTRQWYYESRSGGWWRYDPITMSIVEEAYNNREERTMLKFGGQDYEINFNRMIQQRVGLPHIFRRITFEPVVNAKGIAGILFPRGEPNGGNNGGVPPPQLPPPFRPWIG